MNALETARSLRNLSFVRTAFQLVWAGLVAATITHPPIPEILLIAYPLWDVACTLYDLSSSASGSTRKTQIMNALLGAAAAIAIALNVFHTPAYAVAAFGVWALVAGLLQLVAGVARRKQMGGQWAMILSGAQSTLAGIAFTAGGLGGKVHIKDLGGYAIFGAVYFLIAGVLLHRKLSSSSTVATV